MSLAPDTARRRAPDERPHQILEAALEVFGEHGLAGARLDDIARRAGADVIVAQGMEAGGHRGAFDASTAEAAMVGLMSLLPAVVDAVKVPVVAAGGI